MNDTAYTVLHALKDNDKDKQVKSYDTFTQTYFTDKGFLIGTLLAPLLYL